MREVVGYAINTGDEQKADAGQDTRERRGEAGDGAGDHVGACGVRDYDDAGLQMERER